MSDAMDDHLGTRCPVLNQLFSISAATTFGFALGRERAKCMSASTAAVLIPNA